MAKFSSRHLWKASELKYPGKTWTIFTLFSFVEESLNVLNDHHLLWDLEPLTLHSAYNSLLTVVGAHAYNFSFFVCLSFSCRILCHIIPQKTTKLAGASVFDNCNVFNDKHPGMPHSLQKGRL